MPEYRRSRVPSNVLRALALSGAIAALVFLAPSYASPARAAARTLPPLILWAWERPEDLRALDPDTGVAFLAQTITLATDRFAVMPRRQPLRVDRQTALVAVTRVEVGRSTALASSAIDVDAVAAIVARTATLPQVVVVQLDFDAAVSERPFYRRLLESVRARLDPAIALSITALASWCVGDDWLHGLPIDEAVPMLFRMGPENQPLRKLALARSNARSECRGAVGWSIDEPLGVEADGRRMYVFNPKPWTARTIADVRREAHR